MSGWRAVDSIQFARTKGELSGSVPISELKRLAQVALVETGEFQVQLGGLQDAETRPCLRLRVTGEVTLACQRCLEPLLFEISSDRIFVLVEREDDMIDVAEEEDANETLLADDKLDVLNLIEDEILLQIPIAPMHDVNTCAVPQSMAQNGSGNSAFSVLGTLMDTKD